jgi:hypothetical protein
LTTHSIALSTEEVDGLSHLMAAYPGVSMHLAHLAVFRIGLQFARHDHRLLAAELAAIGEVRRERRLQARTAKKGATPTGATGNGDSNG